MIFQYASLFSLAFHKKSMLQAYCFVDVGLSI